jgi:alanyl-tRNA synthetase
VKLAESPFYAEGGGQISDGGVIACEDGDCLVRVADVVRAGDDQAIVVEQVDGELKAGERVVARVDRAARNATQANHTATHLLHAALRNRLGPHVHQAGSYVGPDKLRFDFSHTQRLSEEERRDVEDQVNAWILRNDPVRPLTTTLDEAQRLGAMALFGEKYGDVVRMVEVGDGSYSRELCGGTHVRSTAEIGLFKIISEGSSASNVRRIEAVTGPEAVGLLRRHDDLLHEAADAPRRAPRPRPGPPPRGRTPRPSPGAPRRSTAPSWWPKWSRRTTPRRSWTSPIASRASWATPPRSCSAPRSTAACTSWPRSRPRSWSAA